MPWTATHTTPFLRASRHRHRHCRARFAVRKRCCTPKPPADFPASRNFPPRPSASFICSNPAALRRWSCSTTSRTWRICRAPNYPTSIRMGQRLTGMSSQQASFPGVPSKFSSRNMAIPAHGSANCFRIRRKIVDDFAIVKIDVHRGHQSRSRRDLDANRRATSRAGPASARGSPTDSARETQNLPAFVVMISPGRRHTASRSSTACGAADFCPVDIRA